MKLDNLSKACGAPCFMSLAAESCIEGSEPQTPVLKYQLELGKEHHQHVLDLHQHDLDAREQLQAASF